MYPTIQQYCVIFLLFSRNQHGVQSFGTEDHSEVKVTCTNRFEFREQLKKTANTCEEIRRSNPICAKKVKVAYSIHPPYVFQNEHDGNKVQGILPDMLKFAIDLCCFGCNEIEFAGPYNHFDKFFKNADLVIPIQTTMSNSYFFGHDFIHMLEVQGVSFIGLPIKQDPDKMVQTIATSVLNTYPLFIIALVMAVTAGVAIWLLDTKWNESEFPDAFPRGPFEGFWWAFVSMTTVGYGDKSPKGIVSRIFAVIWIAVGITIFSMYTAALTSALTSAVIAGGDTTLYQKKIGILNTTTIGKIAVIKENSVPKEYSNIGALTEALKTKKVKALAMDEHIANFYMEHMVAEKGETLALYKRVKLTGSAYGAMAYKKNISQFFDSFFKSNDDQREAMAMLTMEGHTHGAVLQESVTEVNNFFNSTKMMYTTLVALVVITIAIAAIGLIGKYLGRRILRKKKSQEEDENLLSYAGFSEKEIEELAEQFHTQILQKLKIKALENNDVNGNGLEVNATIL